MANIAKGAETGPSGDPPACSTSFSADTRQGSVSTKTGSPGIAGLENKASAGPTKAHSAPIVTRSKIFIAQRTPFKEVLGHDNLDRINAPLLQTKEKRPAKINEALFVEWSQMQAVGCDQPGNCAMRR